MKKKLLAVLVLALIAVMGLTGSALALDPPTVFGIDRYTGDVYEAEVQTGTAELRFNATGTLQSVVSPNGLAWNPLNGYLYFTDYPVAGVGTTAFYYWNGSSVQPVTDALGDPVLLTGDVACATFDSAGNYYYIDGGGSDGNYRTDDLYMVTFDAGFNFVSETKVADLTGNARGWKFDGDIAYKGGYIYGYGSYGWYTFEFFKVEVGTWAFQQIKDFGSWYKGALQLSFGQDGTLYCHASQDAAGTFYAIDLATGTLSAPLASSATAADGHVLLYTDLSAATGAQGLAMVAGTKWNDVIPNGSWDPEDLELPGWTINLYKWNVALNMYDAAPYATATTDGSGGFSFQITEDGLYKVEEVQDPAWTQTGPTSPNYFEFQAVNSVITPVTPAAFDYMNMEFWNHQSTTDISGYKWWDKNKNGVRDCYDCGGTLEPLLANWTITLYVSADGGSNWTQQAQTTTDANGAYSFTGLVPGLYKVQETQQTGWLQTYPTTPTNYYLVNIAADGTVTVTPSVAKDKLNFGNYKKCQNTTGYTPGFWSNKNGKKVLAANPDWMDYLTSYNLVKANGYAFDPTSYDQFRSWLLGANATNMSYMLSVQMAASLLNVAYKGTDYEGLGVIGWDGNWISIEDLFVEANDFLGQPGNNYTPWNDPARAQAEFYKNIFDKLNNNRANLMIESEASSSALTKTTEVVPDGYSYPTTYQSNWWDAWHRF